MGSLTPTLLFNILAAVGLTLLAATAIPAAVSPRVTRSKTWFSMLTSWMVYAASYLLIIGHQSGPEPPRGICGFQMMVIYAAPPLTTLTGLAFLVDVYLRMSNMLFKNGVAHTYAYALLIAPWAIFLAIAAEALIVVADFNDIQRDPNYMYCHSVVNTQTEVSAVICVLGLSMALFIEVKIILVLYRNWALFRQRRMGGDLRFSSLVRILVFTLQTSIGLGLGAFILPNVTNGLAFWSALLPILPVLCGITFGSQSDIVRYWMFWRSHSNDADHDGVHKPDSEGKNEVA